MRIEDCIVRVERRTGGGCLDLAIVFAQQFVGPIFRLLLTFAVPSCLLTWWLTIDSTDMLLIAIPIFCMFSSLMSATLIATVGPQVFGVPLSTGTGLRSLWERIFGFLFLTGVVRVAQIACAACLFVPALVATAMVGHLHEVLFLERTAVRDVFQRLNTLGKGGGFSRNLSRLVGLIAFWVIGSGGLFILIDQLSAWVFNTPIFRGTMITGEDWLEAFSSAIVDDQAVILLLQVAVWLPFPIVRLAWFFCYLDQRIRNECWDLDLQFQMESARLEGRSA